MRVDWRRANGEVDYKKKFKEPYHPKLVPFVADVPQMKFIGIDGHGNPNEENGKYQGAVETLYVLSYAIKMMPNSGNTPTDYFEYVVPPPVKLQQRKSRILTLQKQGL